MMEVGKKLFGEFTFYARKKVGTGRTTCAEAGVKTKYVGDLNDLLCSNSIVYIEGPDESDPGGKPKVYRDERNEAEKEGRYENQGRDDRMNERQKAAEADRAEYELWRAEKAAAKAKAAKSAKK